MVQPMLPCPAPTRRLAYTNLWAAPPQVVAVRHVFCVCVCVCVTSCVALLRFQSYPLTRMWEGFLVCGNVSSFTSPSAGWVSAPKSFASVFVFYILSYLLLKSLGCLSGCPVSSDSIQKLFCGSFLTFKWSFYEFVGKKVVSSSYSYTILGLPLIVRL